MTEPNAWLLLALQIPPSAASLRVRVWRRLQAIGALAVGTSLYALPERDSCREDFEWLLRAVREGGGDGLVLEGRLVAGLDGAALRERFVAVRDEEYRELAKALRKRAERSDVARRRFAEIEARDFFGTDGHAVVAGLLQRLEAAAASKAARKERVVAKTKRKAADWTGRTWVTRERVHVDRIACAWLVLRFVDAQATFRFVASRDAKPRAGELRFDMYDGEFTHDGDRCSFEVMLERFGLDDPALAAIAAIVHDMDLKDSKFGRPETAGVAAVLEGICRGTTDDPERIERGGALFDDLYRKFGGGAA
jgi:hypothetical protein